MSKTINGNVPETEIKGTPNQIIVTDGVVSLPQDIATTSSPEFAGISLGASTNQVHFTGNGGDVAINLPLTGSTHTLTIPSSNADNTFAMTSGYQQLNVKGFTRCEVTAPSLTDNLFALNCTLSSEVVTPTIGIRMAQPTGARVYTLPDSGVANDTFMMASSSIEPSVTGRTFVRLGPIASSAGDDVLYTVPAGKKATSVSLNIVNSTAGSISYSVKVVRGGVSYQVSILTPLTAGTYTTPIWGFVLDAGDQFVLNSTVAGLSVVGSALLVPDTTAITTVYYPITNAVTPYYTAPKTMFGMLTNGQMNFSSINAAICNVSGGSADYEMRLTSGGVDTALGTRTVANNTVFTVNFCIHLNAGDVLSIGSTSAAAGQSIFVPMQIGE